MIPFPDKKYSIIYADPPWKYDFSSTHNRDIENQYPTMELKDICELKVSSEDNSVLFLWATAPKLLDALDVMKSWGFQYRTHFIWDKQIIGCGWWNRGQHELLLIGTKGKFSPPENSLRIPSILSCHRAEHSDKPDQFRELIDKWYPDKTKLEMFYREKKPLFPDQNWDVWGNDV
jgi:N6-adenosine-specific RNA methylase IME4